MKVLYKKVAMAALVAVFASGALAFEKYMLRVPDELNPKEGIKGVTTYFFAPAAVSIPLKDGNWIYIVNESPKQESEGGAAQIGMPRKIVELDVVSRYLEAMKRFPSITVQIGESTFFAYRCRDMLPPQDGLFLNNCYQGVVPSMGSEYSIGIYLPEGRGFDDEVRGILKRVTFVPCPGTAVESALKLYGPGSLLPAASRLPVVKKMVERRGECCELIELLSTLTDDAATKAWCAERLKKLNPGKYAADTRTSIPYYNSRDKAQRKAVMEMLSASDKAEQAVVKVPATDGKGVTDAAVAKTKTVTLPGGVKMEFIWCEKGVFTMGQNDGEWNPSKEEEPRRKITLTKGFWLAKYETTQGQWKSVMGANPSHFKGDDELPVEMVSWKACREFAEKAGAALGAKMRLPTEAEWEYACRAGTRTTYHWGYQPNTAKANYNGEDTFHPERSLPTIGKTVKVGSYEPNPWGFCDMAGNVAEWCEDDWQEKPSAGDATDPLYSDGTQNLKVYRGGAWKGQNFTCRSAERSWFSSANERDWLGVRFVLEETAPSPPQGGTVAPQPPQGRAVAPQSPQGRAVAPQPPQPSAANAKTKTVTLPGGATMEMIYCPPGTYMMGTPESEPERQSKETLHKVKLTKGFWLGKYEVTQAQWESVMGANPSKNKNAGLPVENVTWEECDAFCRKVGGGARFPTEAEWEYACRAGTKTAFYWGTSLNGDRANCKGDSSPYGTKENGPFVGHMTKGGTYGENPWGFCDMSGNVEEWCSDWYDLIGSDEAVDPKGPDTGNFRIVRGGYWRGMAEFCRSGRRGYGHPKAGDDRRGFRMAMDE